jgi:hypothetical protein
MRNARSLNRVGSRLRLLATLLAVFLCFGFVSANAANAADLPAGQASGSALNADQLKRLKGLPEDQRNAIRDKLNQQLAKDACSNPILSLPMGGGDNCENLTAKAFGTFLITPERSLDYVPQKSMMAMCQALAGVGAPATGQTACIGWATANNLAPIVAAAARVALGTLPGGPFVLGTVDVVAFIANAKNNFEEFANTVKTDGVNATNEVMTNLLKVSAFEVNDSFRETWAAYAAVGIVIMALMYFKLWKDVSDEEIDLDTARSSLVWYGPLSILLVLFGPAIGYQLNAWMSGLTDAFSGWTSTRIADFAEAISRFASYQSNGVFGPLAGVVLFGGLFLGAWAMMGLFALHPFALYLIGLGLALLIGFMIYPKYRQRVSKAGTLWISIAVSKPVLLLLMGGVFSFIVSRPAFAADGVDDGLVNATSVFTAAAAMLVLGFSPALLFKFVPLLPAASTRLGAHRESVAGAAIMAGAGAAVGSLIRQRRIDQGRSNENGSTRGSSTQSPAPGNQQANSTGGQSTGQGGRTTPGQPGGGQGSGGSRQDGRTIADLQREARADTKAGRAGQAFKSAGASAVRGSGKIAAGGATAFLMAGREAARQAALRGRRAAHAMAPDTDHISGH